MHFEITRQSLGRRAIIAGMIVLCSMGCHVRPEQQAKLEELRQMAADTPRFPDFEQIDYSDITKPETTVVAYFYRSSASYEEVRIFYLQTLTSRGWQLIQEEPLLNWLQGAGQRVSFQKGDYIIDLEHDTTRESGWDFALDYAWRSNGVKVN